ncbi:MAG: extracellular solute-binding protein [Ruminococcus sp.]|nr:extracellular solute-binding protein [Ruminococcus sp.]MCM1480962.1 extracellular solute-binding protein [Muribaculaceae bacterium]
MKKSLRKILAGVLAAASAVSLAACGDDSSSGSADTAETTTTTEKTEWTGDNIAVDIEDEGSLETADLTGKTLKWMGIYDLNPTNDANERSTELALFEDNYHATIEYMPTTDSQMFDALATAILGGSPPDIFIYEWRAFPYDIVKGQYQPIDSLIDWSDPMWADVKGEADKYVYNGEHYIAPLGYSFNDTQILMYNTTTFEEEGLDDPYTLYKEGKWNWTAFTDAMNTYVGNGTDRYGICGWWANAFVYTAGDTIVTYDGKTFTNNMYSDKIERAQQTIESIWKNQLVKRGWFTGDVFTNGGDTLFYSMGTWAYNDVAKAYPGDVVQIVPFPRDPDQDKDFMSKKIHAYMWVKGSDNAECVKAWFDVNRLVNYDEQYKEITKQKFLANSDGWTSDMYDIAMEFYDEDKFALAYDYGYGISQYMGDEVMPALYEGIVNEQFESWTQGRELYMNILDQEIAAYN